MELLHDGIFSARGQKLRGEHPLKYPKSSAESLSLGVVGDLQRCAGGHRPPEH